MQLSVIVTIVDGGETLVRWLGESPNATVLIRALAAGPFLFVSLCELLPEVFHHREDSAIKVALLLGGIGAVLALHGVDG